MSGTPGRSGKATTLEAKLALADAGRKGGRGRSSTPALPPSTATDPNSDDPDERLGKPLTWGDELKRQQVEGERIANRKREVEVSRAEVELARAQDERDLTRGKLITKERHLDQIRAIVDIMLLNLPIIVDAAVLQHPPEKQPIARHAIDESVKRFREASAAALKGKSS